MPHQLELWPSTEEMTEQEEISWNRIDPQTQQQIVAALTQLIVKAVCPTETNENEEDSHE